MASDQCASGNWHVKEGSVEDFLARWRDFLSESTKAAKGFGSSRLLQDAGDPLHFISLSSWDDAGSRDALRASPEFATGLSRCRELCDDFQSSDCSQVAAF